MPLRRTAESERRRAVIALDEAYDEALRRRSGRRWQSIAQAEAERNTTLPTPTERLRSLNLQLPSPAKPSFNYLAASFHNGLMFVSGQLPKEEGEVRILGRVGEEVNLEQARHAARVCVMQALAVAADALGDIDRIERVIRVSGFVASGPDFHDQPKVVDAASDLLIGVFGDAGRHARSAIGVAELPRDAPVEIEFIFSH